MKLAVAAILSLMISMPAAAQDAALAKLKPKDFPAQPIEFTVVYPAGGGMDVTGRLLAKYVEKHSGERIIVNNRTGGAGMVGHTYLATQAKPDGHTVGVLANLVWGDAMLRAQGRWTLADLEPIGYLNTDALTWVGRTEGPYKGTFVKVALDTGLHEEFMIYLNDEDYFAHPRRVGETVHAAWDAALNHYLPGRNDSAGTPHED